MKKDLKKIEKVVIDRYTPELLGKRISYLTSFGANVDPIANLIFTTMNGISDLASRSVVMLFQNQTQRTLNYVQRSMSLDHGHLACVNGDDANGGSTPPSDLPPLAQDVQNTETTDASAGAAAEEEQVMDETSLAFQSNGAGTKGQISYSIDGNTIYYLDLAADKATSRGPANIAGTIEIQWDKPEGTGATSYSAKFTPDSTSASDEVSLYIRLTCEDVSSHQQQGADKVSELSGYSNSCPEFAIEHAGGHHNNLIVELIPVSVDYIKQLANAKNY
ncbi:hypothetical protein ABMX90_14395 [Vibrio vulnificus]|uniref:hypothetical protein n=1 Tax=Vibrio vulnificus TaxID=672 RepID=UPI004058749F